MAPGFRLCLSTSRSPTAEIDRELQTAGEAGFACIELWAPALEAYLAHHPLVWLDMQMRQHGIHRLVVNGTELPSTIRSAYDEDAMVDQARFLELCTHLDSLGGGTIVVHPAAEREDRDNHSEGFVRTLRAYADLAAPFEVLLAFEFRANRIVPDLDTAQDIVERVAQRNLRLALSTREWRASGTDPRKLEAIKPGILTLVHLDQLPDRLTQAVSDPEQPPVGDRPDLAPELCATLAATGFRGPYCVPLPSGPGTPLERAHAARQAALDLLTPLYVKEQTPWSPQVARG